MIGHFITFVLAAGFIAACDRAPNTASSTAGPPAARQVVVYCSADAPIAQPVFNAFEKKTGIKVKAVFDTEATKTTGLVNRLLAEHESKNVFADVWWSSEPFGSIRLARAGALAPYHSGTAEADFADSREGGWPRELRDADGTWYGFARRVRVLIYNTKFVKEDDVPRDLSYLADEKFKGRVCMARPEFGTTRGHMAALHSLGADVFRGWLQGVADNGLRLYDGNASVARAVGSGEMWLGLTDSDDAMIAQANGWPIAYVPISNVPARPWHKRAYGAAGAGQEPFPEGSMQVANTVALLDGAPRPTEGGALIDFLLSAECEKMLAEGEAHTLPTPRGQEATPAARLDRAKAEDKHPLARQRWSLSELDLERAARDMDEAMGVCGEVLRGK